MIYDALVVGGGIAGLTASAYLAKAGYSILLCEKEESCGGLVNSFERDGFLYDGGIRATENSGVLFPMLKQLGLEIEFVKNNISIGIEDKVIRVNTEDDVVDYQNLLADLYPESKGEIDEIIFQIRRMMGYMEVQYGIDNPVFIDLQKDLGYVLKAILPWMLKYALTAPKISALNEPVENFLKRYTQNQSLIDIIAQHFFQETPAFFALSYIKLYLDYYYPLGGTGQLVEKMVSFVEEHRGKISTNTEITAVDPNKHMVTDAQGKPYQYRRLIWAADLKTLYRLIHPDGFTDETVKEYFLERKSMLVDKTGNDSVLTLFLAVDLDKSYFAEIASEHFFYTPSRIGQSSAGPIPVGKDRNDVESWLAKFFKWTTYEITCPVLRDSSLAPEGKTGLIVSVLFDYALTKHVADMGWYEAFKSYCERCIINTLEASIYPGLKESIIHQFSSTPLTIEKVSGNSEGAITGWAFTNNPIPAEMRIPKILNAIKTPIPDIVQAGQWTYSPSGLPISILTGKLAADRVMKEIKKAH
jgi:phytoene dehydrogenase-like protein